MHRGMRSSSTCYLNGMTLRIALFLLLAVLPAIAAQEDAQPQQAPTSDPAPAEASKPAAPQPLIPRALPGYELRELDLKKPVVVRVGDKVLEIKVPVFVYFPSELPARTEAVQELHRLYDDIVAISSRAAPAPSDFRTLLTRLDAALTRLEAFPPPPVQTQPRPVATAIIEREASH